MNKKTEHKTQIGQLVSEHSSRTILGDDAKTPDEASAPSAMDLLRKQKLAKQEKTIKEEEKNKPKKQKIKQKKTDEHISRTTLRTGNEVDKIPGNAMDLLRKQKNNKQQQFSANPPPH
jgi:hypothetical protein